MSSKSSLIASAATAGIPELKLNYTLQVKIQVIGGQVAVKRFIKLSSCNLGEWVNCISVESGVRQGSSAEHIALKLLENGQKRERKEKGTKD